ncbi:MAG: hypothetical protein MJA27_25920 [Pseudanabaenales cyanobacterium]|nr:hypothetical protein [Pseudanabaenales cyanobacterium]
MITSDPTEIGLALGLKRDENPKAADFDPSETGTWWASVIGLGVRLK